MLGYLMCFGLFFCAWDTLLSMDPLSKLFFVSTTTSAPSCRCFDFGSVCPQHSIKSVLVTKIILNNWQEENQRDPHDIAGYKAQDRRRRTNNKIITKYQQPTNEKSRGSKRDAGQRAKEMKSVQPVRSVQSVRQGGITLTFSDSGAHVFV